MPSPYTEILYRICARAVCESERSPAYGPLSREGCLTIPADYRRAPVPGEICARREALWIHETGLPIGSEYHAAMAELEALFGRKKELPAEQSPV